MPDEKIPSRAAGIIIHDNALLVMYRKKNDQQYFTIPGGTVEDFESPEQAAMREILEETSICARAGQLLYQLDITVDARVVKREYFYECSYQSGVPVLPGDCIEVLRSNKHCVYEPMWLSLEKLLQTKLYPLEIKDVLMRDVKDGFKKETHHASIEKSKMRSA